MNNWKELGKHGRYGDTMMKKIDGDLAHVNAVEYEMSPEYIKETGAGTINPITGKKEYFLGTLATGLSIAGAIGRGFGAMGNQGNLSAGQTAAYDLYQQQLGLVQRRAGLGVQGAELGYDVAQSQYTTGRKDVTSATQAGLRDAQDFAASALSQSNLVTSGTIQEKVRKQEGDIMKKYKSDIAKLFESRAFAEREKDLRIAGINLDRETGQITAEGAYQDTLTSLEQQAGPTSFLGGLFG